MMKFFVNGLKFLRNIVFSNFNFLPFPYKLNFAITYLCNYKCLFCNIWKKRPKNELSIREIKKFLKKANFLNWFNLTGGEPFLRKDLVEIIKTIKKETDVFIVNTTTNGFNPKFIKEKVLKILSLNLPLLIVVISLDGPKNVHEKLRGIKNSFENAIKTFISLRKIKHHRLKVFFGYTLTPLNYNDFFKTIEEVKKHYPKIKISDFHLNLFHISEHYYENLNVATKEEIENFSKKLKKIVLKIIKQKMKSFFFNPFNLIEILYLKYLVLFLKTKQTPLKCKVVQTSIFLDPQGNVYPCTIFNFLLGNLRKENYNLTKILRSERTLKIKKIIEKNKCPNCWTPCEAYQTILGNFFKTFL